MPGKLIGQILLESGAITAEQLTRALETQGAGQRVSRTYEDVKDVPIPAELFDFISVREDKLIPQVTKNQIGASRYQFGQKSKHRVMVLDLDSKSKETAFMVYGRLPIEETIEVAAADLLQDFISERKVPQPV